MCLFPTIIILDFLEDIKRLGLRICVGENDFIR